MDKFCVGRSLFFYHQTLGLSMCIKSSFHFNCSLILFKIISRFHLYKSWKKNFSKIWTKFFTYLRSKLAWSTQQASSMHLRHGIIYRKVASSRPVYYSILELYGQRSQYISIKFLLHKSSENPKMYY